MQNLVNINKDGRIKSVFRTVTSKYSVVHFCILVQWNTEVSRLIYIQYRYIWVGVLYMVILQLYMKLLHLVILFK